MNRYRVTGAYVELMNRLARHGYGQGYFPSAGEECLETDRETLFGREFGVFRTVPGRRQFRIPVSCYGDFLEPLQS